MKWLLLFGLLAGLDNIQAASGVGMMPMPLKNKLNLIMSFAVCETLMLMLGLTLGDRFMDLPGWQSHAELAKTLLLFLCGLVVIALSRYRQDMDSILGRPALCIWMPLALSFDNLFAGLGLAPFALPNASLALVYGFMVLMLCLFGLVLGARLRLWLKACVPDHADWLGGAYLMILAVFSLGTL